MLNPEKIIFITGVMRSGTTLLYQILTEAIPDSNTSGPEFHKLYFLLRIYKNLKFIPLSKNIFKFISLKILESHSNRLGGPDKLIIKDPFIVRYFHLLEILLPESTHIVIVRNPFVNINSILRVRKKQLDKGQNTKLTRYSDTRAVRYFNLLSKKPSQSSRKFQQTHYSL